MRCASRKPDGLHCKAAALRGQKHCNFHSQPGRAAEVGREGGKRRRVFDASKLKRFPPARTPSDLLVIVAQSLSDLREGLIDHRTAHSIGSLSTVCQALMRTSTLEERIAKLEEVKYGRQS